ncbi:MAG: hypothetical protein ACK41Z_11755, partial [Sediminibacterium sp.]
YKLAASLMNSKLQPYLNLRHSFEQNRISNSFIEKATGDFTVIDLGVKAMAAKNLLLTVAVHNLFDFSYREHLSRFITTALPLNAPGRNWVLMLSHQF